MRLLGIIFVGLSSIGLIELAFPEAPKYVKSMLALLLAITMLLIVDLFMVPRA